MEILVSFISKDLNTIIFLKDMMMPVNSWKECWKMEMMMNVNFLLHSTTI